VTLDFIGPLPNPLPGGRWGHRPSGRAGCSPSWSSLFSFGSFFLPALLGSRLPLVSRAELERVYSDPAPLPIEPDLLRGLLEAWQTSRIGDDYGRAAAFGLRQLAEQRATSVAYSCPSREAHGGRRMAWHVPGYTGPTVLSSKGEAQIRTIRFLLQAISKPVRPAFPALPGSVWVDVDLRSAHPVAVATLSGDEQLTEDVRQDIHQRG
jgi:hypothetical protein